jgi:hypothetical protein
MLAVDGAILAVALSACTSPGGPAPAASDTPSESPAAAPFVEKGEPLSGVGPTGFPGIDFPLAAGAKSVTISFECTGGTIYSVELGDSVGLGQAPLEGVCDGETTLAWPIVDRTGPALVVNMQDGVEWTATPTFSKEDFAYDAAITADCEAFAAVYSALNNADLGYTHYQAIDPGEWAERVAEAEVGLRALVAEAQSSLGRQFAEFESVVSDPGREVGLAIPPKGYDVINRIHPTCNINHTPVIVLGEFGG